MKNKLKPKFCQIALILITLLCTSCATTVGMTAAALTSATISVGTAIVTAPFKIIGAMDDDDDEEGNENDEAEN